MVRGLWRVGVFLGGGHSMCVTRAQAEVQCDAEVCVCVRVALPSGVCEHTS